MASVDDFLRALDSIEAEIRQAPDVVFVEMSLTRGRMNGETHETFDENGRDILLLTSRSIHAHWDGLCFDIGGPEFPFVWSPKRSAVHESFPQDVANESESVEFAVWYYRDVWRSAIPQSLYMRPSRTELDHSVEALAYYAEGDRAENVMRSVETAWSLAPEAVIREFGDLSKLPAGPVLPVGKGDSINLWWPTVLLYLALQKVDVVLSASAGPHTPMSFWYSLDLAAMNPAEVSEAHDAFEPTTWTVSLNPPSLMAATRCALRAFRRVAEDSIKKPATVTAGADQPGAADTPVTTTAQTPHGPVAGEGDDKPAAGCDDIKLRIKVHAETKVVEIDGTPYPLSGSDAKKERLVAFIQALIDAKGAPVSATDYEIRTRDVESQHDEITSLIGDDAKPGSGYRIPLEKLMA